MTWHGAVIGFGWTLTTHDVGRDEVFAAQADTPAGCAQAASRPQAGGQFTPQGAAALHEERLVDGFVADTHRLVVRKVDGQASGDLFRAPGPRPSSILSWSVPASLPRQRRPRDRAAATGTHDAGEPFFHIGAQGCVPGKLSRLGTTSGAVGVPLSDGRAIVQATAARGRIAPDLSRYRRGGPIAAPSSRVREPGRLGRLRGSRRAWIRMTGRSAYRALRRTDRPMVHDQVPSLRLEPLSSAPFGSASAHDQATQTRLAGVAEAATPYLASALPLMCLKAAGPLSTQFRRSWPCRFGPPCTARREIFWSENW